jgi:acetoacetyl-CoA synthetase
VLINQLKEHMLHTDLKRQDTIFYFTTCGWMMWNWLVAGLGVGATLVLYDGNPFHLGPEALWRVAKEEKISVFRDQCRLYRCAEEGWSETEKDCRPDAPESVALHWLAAVAG